MPHARWPARSATTALAATFLGGPAIGLVGGCVEPTVDRVVAWVESADDGQGRDVQVYDRGRRYAVRLEPEVPGSGTELLGLAVDPRGLGVALRGESHVGYFGLRDSRQPVLTGASLLGAELSPAFGFTRNADALLRSPDGTTASRYAFMPTSSSRAGDEVLLEPPDALSAGAFELISAADAPVLYWVEFQGSPSRVSGRVAAFAYPSDIDPDAITVDAITELGSGQAFGAPPALTSDLQIGDQWCPHRACLAPDGRTMITPAAGRCRFWVWDWSRDPSADGSIPPEEVVIEDGCPAEPRAIPALFAAIDVDLAVLDDGDRVYLADLSNKTMRSAPKLWANAGLVRLGEGGRSVVLVSDDSRMVLVDADGPRVLSGDAIPCAGPPATARISPSGMWMARVCQGDGTFAPVEQAVIIRVSPLGVETFISVPMSVLGIDDGGNMLLYSEASSGEPRGLFVIDDSGGVTRIDPLEPEPATVALMQGQGYFAPQALRP